MSIYKNELYKISTDGLKFPDMIVATLLRCYLSKMEEAIEKLNNVVNESLAVKYQEGPAFPLHTAIRSQELSELIDEAAEYVKERQVTSPDPEINNIFSATADVLDEISGTEVVADISADLVEFIVKCDLKLKFDD